MSNVSVLIVGAGPTGLLLAYELARHGVSFRIIDKKPEPTQQSNAAVLQTRTLEIFKQIGLVDDFLRVGQPCKTIHFYDKGKPFAKVSFDKLESIYQFILALPQAATENILNNKLIELHHKVERSRELTAVLMTDTQVECIVQHQDGIQEIIYSDWLIGCDGAHSTVREKTGFQFPGEDLPEQFVVADTILDTFLRHDELNIFINNGTVLGVFPLDSNRFRIGGNMREDPPRKIYSDLEVKELVATRTHNLFTAREVNWASPFWIHSKIADKMRLKRVFLAGDAAHIHSPLGGQGMNTGLQDAHNLAWKLALVVQGRADICLLDSYEEERYPVIKKIVNDTDRFTRMMLITNPVVNFFKKYSMKLVFSIPSILRIITHRLTQISLQYKQSCALCNSSQITLSSPTVGERAPDVKINHSNFFYSYLNDNAHHIICFTGENDIFKAADDSKKISQSLLGPYKDVVVLHLVTPHLLDEPIDQIFDETNAMHQLYQIKKPTVMVIRPDGYIGYASQDFSLDKLKVFFQQYLI
jgi:2-polyprenyl-6-methoxyphenol hydroxylase-like FAD-dependent oxidoreductase